VRRRRPGRGGRRGRRRHRPRRHGQGEQIAANKVRGVRAALCHDVWLARMARSHNDANVLSMGARVVAVAMAKEIASVFLSTAFEGDRHVARVRQLVEIEDQEASGR
jgi:ribose 5-phosphate isomerase B